MTLLEHVGAIFGALWDPRNSFEFRAAFQDPTEDLVGLFDGIFEYEVPSKALYWTCLL